MEKNIISHQTNRQVFLEVCSEEPFIDSVQDALDLLGELFG